MAELATSLVVAPVVSLLKKKVVSLLTDQYKVMEGMEKNYDTLKLRLEAIEAVIVDAEKQGPRRGVQEWLEQVKTAAYKAHEVFDDFEYEVLRRRAKENGHITEFGVMDRVKLFLTHNRVAFRSRMGYRLRRIVDTFKDLMEEMKTFEFNKLEPKATAASLELREMDFLIDDHEDIVAVGVLGPTAHPGLPLKVFLGVGRCQRL